MKFPRWVFFCLMVVCIIFPATIVGIEDGIVEKSEETVESGEGGQIPHDEEQNIVGHSSDTYTSLKLLLIAAKNAKSGSVLKLHTGTHRDTGEYEILASGITIEAKHTGKAIIKPHSAGLMIKVIGDNNRIAGLQFVNGYGINDRGGLIEITGSNNTLTNLNFYKIYVNHYINIIGGSQFNEISYCNFELKPKNKARAGTVVVIHTDPDIIGYHKVHHCSFQKMDGGGGDYGNEPLRVGMDGLDEPYISRVVIEYNVFNNTYLGDSETISIKSRENIIRYNTFGQNQGGMLSFRSGDFNVAYGNWFIGSGGIRIKEVNNIYIYNNYFQNAGSASDKTYPVDYYELEDRDADLDLRNNITVYFNTFVESEYVNLDTIAKPDSQSGWFANNIFLRRKGDLFTGVGLGINFLGNLYEGTLGEEFFLDHELDVTEFNPLDSDMELNTDGTYYVPSDSSPARGNAALWPTADSMSIFDIPVLDDDPLITLDITGRLRPTIKKDVGCYQHLEFETEIINVPMTVDNVGPIYAIGDYPTMAPTMQPTYSQQPTVSPTTAYPTTSIPTDKPTVSPWFMDPPTPAPSISFGPTNPTYTPTMKPSKPTKSPTFSPSAKPSTTQQPSMKPAASGAPWFRLPEKQLTKASKTLDDGILVEGTLMKRGVPWYYDPSRSPSKKPHSPSPAPTKYSPPTDAPWFGTDLKKNNRMKDEDSKKEEQSVSTSDTDGEEDHQLFGHTGKAQPIQSSPKQQLTKGNTRTDQNQDKVPIGQETVDQRAYYESMMALKNSLVMQSTSESEIPIESNKQKDHDKMAPWNDPGSPTSSPIPRETGIPSSAPWFHSRIKTTKDDKGTEDYDKDSVKGTKENLNKQSKEWEKEEKVSLQNSKETLQSLEKKLDALRKTEKNTEKKLRGS